MRAKQFILKEYSREKTATVFGNKLIVALGKDKSHTLAGTQLGTDRAFIDQKTKVGSEITAEQRQQLIDHIMVVIENSDPTANKEYVQWLTKVYANQGIKLEDIISRGNSALKMYHEFKVKKILPAEYRDIGRIDFAGLESIAQNLDLRNALAAKEEQDAAKAMPKGDAETVFENEAVRIIVPKNEEAACYYGQGTRWCTAGRDNNMYDRYARDGDLYILLPKQPKYDGEKYQLHFSSNQFMDEGDNTVDSVVNLITKRFGDLLPFFMEREPVIKDWLVFTPDEVLEPLLEKISRAVNDHVSEIVNDWEVQDDYWWDYLRKEGYVYPEGHEEEGSIDWDKVAEADLSYTDWNYEAADFIRMINNSVDLTPQEVRELAQEEEEEYNGDVGVNDLDTIIGRSIVKNIRGRDGDGGVPEWITDHVYVKKTGGDGAWDVSLLYTDKEGKRVEYAIH
jgi:hypothetical protein